MLRPILEPMPPLATGNVANNAADAQPNVVTNQRQNAGAQPPLAQANHTEGS
jgi:hypothetical protein